jgi:hypothetical protein
MIGEGGVVYEPEGAFEAAAAYDEEDERALGSVEGESCDEVEGAFGAPRAAEELSAAEPDDDVVVVAVDGPLMEGSAPAAEGILLTTFLRSAGGGDPARGDVGEMSSTRGG